MDQMRLQGVFSAQTTKVAVIGCGATGSAVALQLAKIGLSVHLYDNDTIESHNIPNQMLFSPGDIGRPKAEVLSERLALLTDKQHPAFVRKVTAIAPCRGYEALFLCVDSIASRRGVVAGSQAPVIFDARIGARTASTLRVEPDQISAYVKHWLFSSEEEVVDRAVCGTRQTVISTAMICASMIVWDFIDWTNAGERGRRAALPVHNFDTATNTYMRTTLEVD